MFDGLARGERWSRRVVAAVGLVLTAAVGARGQEAMVQSDPKPQVWRGVHIMAWGLAGGPEGLVPLKQAVAKVLTPSGVNVVILEVGYNFEFKSHPELIQTKFITQADAREFVRFCRECGVRVIPQFNCLGHQSWRHTLYPLLTEYRDMEEPPDDAPDQPWAQTRSWCPLHPRVNQIVFALMDELINAFEADAFHVGMDEVLVIGSKKCERCRDKSPAELFAHAVNAYHRHLVVEKKLTMLMWGDRLLDASVMHYGRMASSNNGTASAIDLIPKDIIICDWHYDRRTDYPSVPYFQEKGFRVWPASWNNVEATKTLIAFARRDATDRMLGHLSTTWTLEPGGFARALLGERDPALVSQRAIEAAAAFQAAAAESLR